jgi:hypothetical protein
VSSSYSVVGGGISGLVAAYRLRVAAGPDASITVFDPADRLGGVLRTERVGGQPLDVGAEAFVARRPEVPALLAELGLAAKQIGTTGARPLIYSQRRLHPLPRDTLNGIPAQPSALAGLVDDATIARMFDERTRPLRWRPGADPTVADLVGDRFGEQVVARSVDPLLAGVYAGSAATIGLRSAAPTLAEVLDRGVPSLTDAVREALPPPLAGSVFGAVEGGYAVLLDALVRRARVKWAQVAIERVTPSARGWELVDDEGARWQARGPPRSRDASRWLRRRWWRWRCRAARRCPSSPVFWWPAENGCAPRRLPCRHASGGGVAMSSWCGCHSVGSAMTWPEAPATRICSRGRSRTWRRSSASRWNPWIVASCGGSTRCPSTRRVTAASSPSYGRDCRRS